MTRKLKKELWPHMIKVNHTSQCDEIEAWLEQTLGIFKGRWNAVYNYDSTDFYFRNERDAVYFSLRWL